MKKNEYIGQEVEAGGKLTRVHGIIIDVLKDKEDESQEWYRVYEDSGNVSLWDFNELTFVSPSPLRNESWEEKVQNLQRNSSKPKEDCEKFIDFVADYLSSCGYFHADYNIHGIFPKDYPKYRDKCFGTWLLDMALQYNMEIGLEYQCNFIRDRHENQ